MEHHNNEHTEHHHEEEHHSKLFDLIRTRRSVRKYKDKPVPWDSIVEILQAAKYAPIAGNVFNLKFLVIKSESKRRSIAESCVQQYWMQDAPIHIVVVGEPEKAERYYGTRGVRLYTVQQAGASIENMLLTAHSLGLGSCWVGAFDEEEIRAICNLPETVNVQAIVTIGFANEVPEPPPKMRIEHIMFFEKWWGRIEGPKNALGLWAPYIKKGVTKTNEIVNKHSKKLVDKIKEKFKKKEKK